MVNNPLDLPGNCRYDLLNCYLTYNLYTLLISSLKMTTTSNPLNFFFNPFIHILTQRSGDVQIAITVYLVSLIFSGLIF